MKYSYFRDIAPVTGISTLACIMVVNPSFPAMSVRKFIAFAKANPGRILRLGGRWLDAAFVRRTVHVRSGGLRGLAVTSGRRFHELPNLPTVGEFVPGFEANAVQGLCTPKKTATDTIERLNREVSAILDDQRVKTQVAELGSEPLSGSPAEFTHLLATDSEKWARVIRAANIKLG